jgi:hypothetical protein
MPAKKAQQLFHDQFEINRDASLTSLYGMLSFYARHSVSEKDFGNEYIKKGYIERIDLSSEPKYKLTFYGNDRASHLIDDLIRRA